MDQIRAALLALVGATVVQLVAIIFVWAGWVGVEPIILSTSDFTEYLVVALVVLLVLSAATCFPMSFVFGSPKNRKRALIIAAGFGAAQVMLFSLFLFWSFFPPFILFGLTLFLGLALSNYLTIWFGKPSLQGSNVANSNSDS